MLRLSQADAIIAAALTEARARNLAPLAVAVLDAGGHLVAYKREDGAGIVRFEIAFGKAWGSLGMGFGSRELTERASGNPVFFSALVPVSGGRMVPSPGGVLILNAEGEVIGAAGISGDLGPNDELCAVAGIEAAGLRAAPGAVV
ncbi:GlcG/HbpS family heme-binding protein [Pannonibacter sp. Q-1]|uniref:GlcG protein n=1 Tax=Pannonibacter phragmitetus TaxID=121719 RepID=A0A0L0IU45_9HYPH|nr:heme-binding protein [Pannonibacter phragmitetus]ALV29259.1 GlcG protein [Pannonibacter phragmitetus]KND17031.1 GlcG protein [Pannonibacter phragmitetus]